MLGGQKWGCLTEPSGAKWVPLHGPASKANERDIIQSKCAPNAAGPQHEHYLSACSLPYLFSTKTTPTNLNTREMCL